MVSWVDCVLKGEAEEVNHGLVSSAWTEALLKNLICSMMPFSTLYGLATDMTKTQGRNPMG